MHLEDVPNFDHQGRETAATGVTRRQARIIDFMKHPTAYALITASIVACGAAMIFDAPDGVWVVIAVIAGMFLIAAVLQHWREGRTGAPPEPPSSPTGRVGYRGRPGSTGTFRRSTFGDGLDTAIDNEGDVDVEDSDWK